MTSPLSKSSFDVEKRSITIPLDQGSPEWEEYRSGRIGASLAPIIMGVSLHQTAYQLWEEMVGLRSRVQSEWVKENILNKGLRDEDPARLCFSQMQGVEVFPSVEQHPEIEWMFCSLDGLNLDGTLIVEIKNPGHSDHEIALKNKVPDHYYPQLQHQMAVTGLQKCYYFSFYKENGQTVVCNRDDAYIDLLIEKETEFKRCVDEFDPPELTDKDYRHRDDQDWFELQNQFRDMSKRMKALVEEEKQLREKIIKMALGQSSKGFGLSVNKVVKKGNVDYSRIPQLKGVDLERYRKEPSQYWRVMVK